MKNYKTTYLNFKPEQKKEYMVKIGLLLKDGWIIGKGYFVNGINTIIFKKYL